MRLPHFFFRRRYFARRQDFIACEADIVIANFFIDYTSPVLSKGKELNETQGVHISNILLEIIVRFD